MHSGLLCQSMFAICQWFCCSKFSRLPCWVSPFSILTILRHLGYHMIEEEKKKKKTDLWLSTELMTKHFSYRLLPFTYRTYLLLQVQIKWTVSLSCVGSLFACLFFFNLFLFDLPTSMQAVYSVCTTLLVHDHMPVHELHIKKKLNKPHGTVKFTKYCCKSVQCLPWEEQIK